MKPGKLIENLYRQLEKHKVRYLIVGGMAVNYYGIIRATKDIDLFLEASEENLARLLESMEEAGFETASETSPEKMLGVDLTVFKDIVRVDVMTKVAGLEFEKAWERKTTIEIRKNSIYIPCIEDLIASKSGTGRTIDEQDNEKLRIVGERSEGNNCIFSHCNQP